VGWRYGTFAIPLTLKTLLDKLRLNPELFGTGLSIGGPQPRCEEHFHMDEVSECREFNGD
jgi:hypothetical protein